MRQEELPEMDGLLNEGCEIMPVSGGCEYSHGKVNVLLQSHISRMQLGWLLANSNKTIKS